MTNAKIMKWITGACELFLGIPVLGGLIIISTAYAPLVIMFILHVITWILSSKENEPKYGSALGIVTSLIAWIPIVGMIMHIVTGIVLLFSAARKNHMNRSNTYTGM